MEKAGPKSRASGDSGAAPLALHGETVLAEWIDYNGHMNVAFYVLAFDHATDAFLDGIDLGLDYRRRADCSIFVAEAHITYEREVSQGDRLSFTTQVLGFDGKRLHLFHRMYLGTAQDALVSTNELMMLHVDLKTRRSAPLPPPALERITAIYAAHEALPRPPQAGRVIAVTSKPRA